MSDLHSELRSHGINIQPEFDTDRVLRDGSAWFIGKTWYFKDKEYRTAWYGDYAQDLKTQWKSWQANGHDPEADPEFTKHYREEIQAKLKAEREERERIHHEKRDESQKEFSQAVIGEASQSPYLLKKGIDKLYNARLQGSTLYIPMCDGAGVLWNIQRIFSEARGDNGNKFFKKGARIDGLFHTLNASDTGPIYVAEGFATAATVAMAYPAAHVVCAFNAGNLLSVSLTLRELHPHREMVIVADNDAFTVIKNVPTNVGVIKASEAAARVNASAIRPEFKSQQPGETDFNDLMLKEGLDEVRKQFERMHNAPPTPPDNTPPETDGSASAIDYLADLKPLAKWDEKKDKYIMPTEKQVAEELIKNFADNIMREDKSLFLYKPELGHWEECGDYFKSVIMRAINFLNKDTLTSRKLESGFSTFMTYVPHVPVGRSFYQANPFVANFKDCTVHFLKRGGKYVAEKLPHNRNDLLTNALPFNFPTFAPDGGAEETPMFDSSVANMFKTDDLETMVKKHEFILELFGNCLAPMFPIIALFYGKSGTGKSTVVKILNKMLSSKYTSQVQPCEMRGFMLEGMIGKLVNIHIDLNTVSPWQDSAMKSSTDRQPVTLDRKYKSTVRAYLPAVHVFATNQPPVSRDGASGAYGRRMSLIHITGDPIKSANLDHAEEVWEKESNGIVGAAWLALLKLCDNGGVFTKPASSDELIKSFESDSDPVKQFIEAIRDSEIICYRDGVIGRRLALLDVEGDVTKRIKKGDLLGTYYEWSKTVGNRVPMSRNAFYRRIAELGFNSVTSANGIREFTRIYEI